MLGGYRSSAIINNLEGLEKLVGHLKPPQWPEGLFGKIDSALSARGAALYRERCLTCHMVLSRTDLTTRPIESMHLIRNGAANRADTDIWMACNAYLRASESGRLEGEKYSPDGRRLTIGSRAALSVMLQVTAQKVLIGKDMDVVEMAALGFIGIEPVPRLAVVARDEYGTGVHIESLPGVAKESDEERCKSESPPHAERILAYKARPLDGIWATAPYLHNGSVASLYELMLPQGQRKKSFFVGSHEFDPREVGFSTAATPTSSLVDTTVKGSSNAGHDYVPDISDQDRWALVEYMKSL